ncbi:MAG: PEP/pyruvate-binding domain-containing protein [Ignavibacteria bacterium]|jgi:hypothetical protein
MQEKVEVSYDNMKRSEWRIILDMIRKTDPALFTSITRKLLYLVCWKGIKKAEELLKESGIALRPGEDDQHIDENKPLKKKIIENYDEYVDSILRLVYVHIKDEEIYAKIHKWILDDKSKGLIKALETKGSSLSEISDAIRKYYLLSPEKFDLSLSTIKGLRVSLLRRFFTEDLDFIRIAKEYIKLIDFYGLIDKMIFMPTSHGKLGGKGSGMFLAANILKKKAVQIEVFKDIKIPKTYYMASDGVLAFMQYNNLEETYEQKYKEIDEVKIEYPQIVHLFKSSQFPPDLIKGLSLALDDLGENPIVVRSSSLLEDQAGASFSGKYKSLFIANQGTKQERLNELMDAVAEVYASTFGPDPIEYRNERGLLDFHEEMGIMIQEVVGNKIGHYYFPTFAGVAFSNNEFRWSPRIKREDGLLRIVPGLGTRSVDRVGDDYPVLIAPGQPTLKINQSVDEIVKYTPKKMDVINLKTKQFETVDFCKILSEYGDEIPGIQNVVSFIEGDMIRQPMGFDLDFNDRQCVGNFLGLRNSTNFVNKTQTILKTLEECLNTPVDVEFASDGKDFYILQCRPQSSSIENAADEIPQNVKQEEILFSANQFVSNGKVPNITYLVYVDPVKYGEIKTREELLQVGRAVGRLNKVLPKRKFILMGPGRWGSRGDIKLGVSVTYSDINNTAMLIEIAKKKGSYVPDLSFGTHFFQDLVEAEIRYLPLYPDNESNQFNGDFLNQSENLFEDFVKEYNRLKDVIKVIDIPKSNNGKILKVYMNGDLDKALAVIKNVEDEISRPASSLNINNEYPAIDHWTWRKEMLNKMIEKLDAKKFGIKKIYLVKDKNNPAANSHINLIVHTTDDVKKNELFANWIEGWSYALSEMNFQKTSVKTNGLLKIKFMSDVDIKKKTPIAKKIKSVTDPVMELL